MNSFHNLVKPYLSQSFEIIEVYDNGTKGANEVARIKLANGVEVVQKVMLAIKIYHQRRKALTEYVMYLLDKGMGGNRVVPDLFVGLFELNGAYAHHWGDKNAEGHKRICQVVREYAPAMPGDEWRGEVYRNCGNLPHADEICKSVLNTHPDAERISILDFLTINQDRSARNWVTDHGSRFYAIDNGMAWFHEYPNGDEWKQGCVVDDVIIQVGEWQFISGVFSTLWAGKELSPMMQRALSNFNEQLFLAGIERAAIALGFPKGLSKDWRFEGILRRLRWIKARNRQPAKEEYRSWLKDGSNLMTPPEVVKAGGKVVWMPEWDK